MEEEREKLPRVDRNAVEELNAYVVGHRDGRIETMASNIYIYLVSTKKSFADR